MKLCSQTRSRVGLASVSRQHGGIRVALACGVVAVLVVATLASAGETRFSFAQDPEEKPKNQEFDGRLVPADADEIRLHLDGNTNLEVIDVAKHGTTVNAGDVVARFDTADIDEKIEEAEFALRQAQQELELAKQDRELKRQAAQDRLAKSEQEAAFARRKLEGFLEHELAHKAERERLMEQGAAYGLENEEDELQQLERMYDEDELVDATEEIVLKRARRRLAQSQARQRLSDTIREYDKNYGEKMGHEELVLKTEHAVRSHEREMRSEAIAAARSDASLQKSERNVHEKERDLRKLIGDRDQYTVRAARSGVILHGAVDAEPGEGRLQELSTVNTSKAFLTIAQPGRFKVVSKIPESLIFQVQTGKAVRVVPEAAPDDSFVGALRVDDYPMSSSKDGNLYEADVSLPKLSPRYRSGMRVKIRIADADPETAEREGR